MLARPMRASAAQVVRVVMEVLSRQLSALSMPPELRFVRWLTYAILAPELSLLV